MQKGNLEAFYSLRKMRESECEIDDQILLIILYFNRVIYNTFFKLAARGKKAHFIQRRPNIDLSYILIFLSFAPRNEIRKANNG